MAGDWQNGVTGCHAAGGSEGSLFVFSRSFIFLLCSSFPLRVWKLFFKCVSAKDIFRACFLIWHHLVSLGSAILLFLLLFCGFFF